MMIDNAKAIHERVIGGSTMIDQKLLSSIDKTTVIENLEKVWDAFNHMEHELYMDYDGISMIKYKFCPECGKAVKWNEYSSL